jgi:hypothetical protein
MDGGAALAAEDVPALKLVQLRAALEARGLSADGSKGELVERLQAALRGSSSSATAAAGRKRQRADDAGADDDSGDVGPRVPVPPAAAAAAAGDSESSDDDVGPRVPQGYAPDDGDSDDGVGPAVPAGVGAGGDGASSSSAAAALVVDAAAAAAAARQRRRQARVVRDEPAYLAALPCAAMYEKSYMHRAPVTHVAVTPGTDFMVTASADGVLKFWKKLPRGEVEFVKAYRAHLGPLAGLAVSGDGLRLASIGADDGTLKVYDVLNFDMTDMARLPFQVRARAG